MCKLNSAKINYLTIIFYWVIRREFRTTRILPLNIILSFAIPRKRADTRRGKTLLLSFLSEEWKFFKAFCVWTYILFVSIYLHSIELFFWLIVDYYNRLYTIVYFWMSGLVCLLNQYSRFVHSIISVMHISQLRCFHRIRIWMLTSIKEFTAFEFNGSILVKSLLLWL